MKVVAENLRRAARRLVVAATAVMLAAIGTPTFAAPPEVPLKTAFSTDLTDTWWNSAESGWGMQLTQTGNFIFVTVYAYGADGKPTWFGGGVTSTGGATFTGKLYVTTGPYYGGAFDPAAVTVREAGTMTFEALSGTTANFTYTLDGISVTKAVSRQPLTLDDFSGAYVSVLTQTISGCTDAVNNGTGTAFIIFQIAQNGNAMTISTANGGGGTCSVSGAYAQLGRYGRLDGTYNCSSGEVGTAVMTEMNNHVRQFNARMFFQSTNLGCLSAGRITGVVPDGS